MGCKHLDQVEQWLIQFVEQQENNDLHFVIEGSERDLKSMRDAKGRSEPGRKMKMKFGKEINETTLQVRHNSIGVQGVQNACRRGAILSVSGTLVGTMGLNDRSWSRWIQAVVKADSLVRGRSSGMCDKVTFSTPVAETVLPTRHWHEMSGKELKLGMVSKARAEEVRHLTSHGVYQKMPINQYWLGAAKVPIGTRWIDINKGDEISLAYRSILVVEELKSSSWHDHLFAATPPSEAENILF